MIALLEAKSNVTEDVIQSGLMCINSDESQNYYGQALRAYALALGNHTAAANAVDSMVEKALKTENTMYWRIKELGGKIN